MAQITMDKPAQDATESNTAQEPGSRAKPSPMQDPKTGEYLPSNPNGTKRKRSKSTKSSILSQTTIRDPPFSYLHLQYLTPPSNTTSQSPLDEVTAHLHLTAALSQFLGLHGAAIPVDVLRLEGEEVWVRIPSQDRGAFVAAVGGWVGRAGQGWRVRGWSSWGPGGGKDGGQDLFGD